MLVADLPLHPARHRCCRACCVSKALKVKPDPASAIARARLRTARRSAFRRSGPGKDRAAGRALARVARQPVHAEIVGQIGGRGAGCNRAGSAPVIAFIVS